MISLAVPVLAMQCVAPASAEASRVRPFAVLSGPDEKVDAFLKAIPAGWTIAADDETDNARTIRFALSDKAVWRDVASVIYKSQMGGLVTRFVTEPPMCRAGNE